MIIQVLMSTCNAKNIDKIIKNKNIQGKCLIVNQLMPTTKKEIEGPVEMFSYNEKGLSKSRNRLIENATGDIGIITDDDITFVPNYEKILNKYYQETNADVITFNMKMGNEIIGKNKKCNYNKISILSVNSTRISFNINKIKESNIKFDERFGLGAKYKSGEENIFLTECLTKGLKIIHIPIVLNEHPVEKTTGDLWDQALIESKGALSYCLFGKWHFIFKAYLMLTKTKLYKPISMHDFNKYYKKGLKEFKEGN